jgi:toxin ParE1/3/4
MTPYIYLPARRQLIDIWHYTNQNWGLRQADQYLQGLASAINHIAGHRNLWKKIPHHQIPGIFFISHQHHFIFFRCLSGNRIGIISILHNRQDIPNRLREAMDETS